MILAGHEMRAYAELDSTNTLIKALAREGAPHGLVIAADTQTDGRGRMRRKWLSLPGEGAWFSMLIAPGRAGAPVNATRLDAARAHEIVFVCALGMARAVRALSACEVLIKWPNDLVAGGKKLAGMMCEMQASAGALEWAVLGIGVNLTGARFTEALPWATSVERESGDIIARDALIERFLIEFDALFDIWRARALAPILDMIAPISATLNRRVRVYKASDADTLDFEGEAKCFAPDGALIVEKDDGARALVRAGDVSVRGVMGYV